MVTLNDIAKIAGVTPSTVSRVLNGQRLNKTSAETKERIRRIAREYGYKPNYAARALQQKKTYMFGYLIPNMTSFMNEVTEGIQEVAIREDYSCLIYIYRENCILNHVFELAAAKKVDGIIWRPMDDYLPDVSHIIRDIPLIQLLSSVPVAGSHCVLVDHALGAFRATEYLIKSGHCRIAHLTTQDDHGQQRFAGYKQALQQYGIDFEPKMVLKCNYEWESSKAAALDLLRTLPRPSAVVAASDSIAVGVIRAAKDLQLHVPEDLSVVGYDDMNYSTFMEIPLTTVAQPKKELGRVTMEMLMKAIRKEPVENIVLEPELIVRSSAMRYAQHLVEKM